MDTVRPSLKELLQQSLIIGDGAMATYLYQQGVPVGICYEELCLSRPQLVATVHQEYYQAGARLIETNTFGANREKLARYGLEGKVAAINKAAVRLARDAVGEDAYIAGSIGAISSGRVVGELPLAYYQSMYLEQADTLLEGGVDAIILETFLDVEELLLALRTVRSLTAKPIIAQLAPMEVARTRDGSSLTEAFQALLEAGADVIGLNCRLGPAELVRSLEKTITPQGALLSAFPDAGRLSLAEGETRYKSSPGYFAESALRLRKQGVRLVGGCCGTTPQHIAAMAQALQGLSPAPRVNPPRQEAIVRVAKPAREVKEAKARRTLIDLVKERPTVIVEFDPPRDLDVSTFLEGAVHLRTAGADLITLADNALATARMSNVALGAILKSRLGIEPLLHVACRDRNLLGQHSHLMGLNALGIHHILIITGDPCRIGDHPGASSVHDLSSIELIRMAKRLNEGISFSGRPLKLKATFVVGASFNPNARNLDAALRRLERKITAGADFIMTQPVYDERGIQQLYEMTRDLPVPVFVGIMPLTSYRNALFLHNEVPGITISSEIIERLRSLEGEDARQEGVKIAKDLLERAMPLFNGIYLITPFSYYQMTTELTRHVRSHKP